MDHPPSMLNQLPPKISTAIQSYLSNRDIKSLRLTCKSQCAIAQLRLDRVFLSANPRNIEVLRAIADHEVFRERVVEIIWDDARLEYGPFSKTTYGPESPDLDSEYQEEFDRLSLDDDSDEDSGDDEGTPLWFIRACRLNVLEWICHKCCDVVRPDHVAWAERAANMSFSRSWKYYRHLLRQQREVLETDEDYKAFNYGLLRFPALRRVTITPAAHGWLFRPLYETPMIRAFPPSFNYPIPRTWPLEQTVQRPWKRTSESGKDKWRAFRLVTRSLAVVAKVREEEQRPDTEPKPGITEIVIDVNQLLTGLNVHMFGEECDEQRNLVTALRRPNFRRLDLALGVSGHAEHFWPAYRSGLLRRTLEAAPDLEHFSFSTDERDHTVMAHPWGQFHNLPLRDFFPIEAWTRLRHFALARFTVRENDLLSFLGDLPPTLRSVELSFLFFFEGNWRDLLTGVRDRLGWRERPVRERPRLSICLCYSPVHPRRGVWADVPVKEFLYHDGSNPFGADGTHANKITYGCGGIVKDSFDPAYERPWVDPKELQRLGYTRACER